MGTAYYSVPSSLNQGRLIPRPEVGIHRRNKDMKQNLDCLEAPEGMPSRGLTAKLPVFVCQLGIYGQKRNFIHAVKRAFRGT